MLLLLLLQVRLQRVDQQAGLLPERVTAERRVVFVCVENAARSLMAEAIFNAEPPAGWAAGSAGTRPAAQPNPRTERFLREIGLELPPHPPQELTASGLDAANLIVTMGCLDDASCPANLRRRELRDWKLPDPRILDDDGFRAVRDEIRRRIRELARELRAGPDSPRAGPTT
ncbi:MAG: low molecular weight phosphatase family protein [Thermoplasmata archaeon]|nr:low molecular weight phosphatase family protein [Thermoplasmata archaeon]MCI4332412.1 low molecular weight phosphatase family protein [Thermoplasmata archaeon]